jgi:4'-phosphopantetheinyl transferase
MVKKAAANSNPRPTQPAGQVETSANQIKAPAPGMADVWVTALTTSSSNLEALRRILSHNELDRAARFHFDEHRTRYIVAHGCLRQLLSRYLSIPASSIEFGLGTNGKPSLAGEAAGTGLQFNLAHSADLSLTAVVTGSQVGVDVEQVRILPDANELVQRFFSKREAAEFAGMTEAQKPLGFFRLWTRKEAWLKATGDGIAHLLDKVEVSFSAAEAARLLRLPEGFSSLADWSLCNLEPGPGYVGALAIPRKDVEVRVRFWNDQPNALLI